MRIKRAKFKNIWFYILIAFIFLAVSDLLTLLSLWFAGSDIGIELMKIWGFCQIGYGTTFLLLACFTFFIVAWNNFHLNIDPINVINDRQIELVYEKKIELINIKDVSEFKVYHCPVIFFRKKASNQVPYGKIKIILNDHTEKEAKYIDNVDLVFKFLSSLKVNELNSHKDFSTNNL